MENKHQKDFILRFLQKPSTWVPLFLFLGLAIGFALVFPVVSSYLIIGVVLALMAHPIFTRLKAVRYKGKHIPDSLASFFALSTLMLFFILFWLFLLPLIGYQLSNWQKIDAEQVVTALEEPIGAAALWLKEHGFGEGPLDSLIQPPLGDSVSGESMAKQVRKAILNWVDVFWLGSALGNFMAAIANLFLAFVSGFFIAFFLLKDKNSIRPAIEKILPAAARPVLIGSWIESRRLLTQYFNGIILQWLIVFVLEGFGLWLVGLAPGLAISIALIASLFNVIPYAGPLIGSAIGLLLGVSAHLDVSFYQELWPLIWRMAIVFFVVQQIDGYAIQPFVFSSRLNVHPLEIFLVSFIGYRLAGFYGLIFAVPGYTVFRVLIRQSWGAVSKEWEKNTQEDSSNTNLNP